jgi:hypothetical protein
VTNLTWGIGSKNPPHLIEKAACFEYPPSMSNFDLGHGKLTQLLCPGKGTSSAFTSLISHVSIPPLDVARKLNGANHSSCGVDSVAREGARGKMKFVPSSRFRVHCNRTCHQPPHPFSSSSPRSLNIAILPTPLQRQSTQFNLQQVYSRFSRCLASQSSFPLSLPM